MSAFFLAALVALSAPPVFDHAAHFGALKGADCNGCHPPDATADRVAPGSHASCGTADCHAADFGPAIGTLCTTCHVALDWSDMAPMRPFPRSARADSALCITFSHAKHLTLPDLGAEGDAACLTCHRVDAEAKTHAPPRHDACAGCHTEQAKGVTHPMGDCAGCHVAPGPDDAPCRPWLGGVGRLIDGFDHDTHRRDPRNGRPVSCGQCHVDAPQAETVQAIALLRGKKKAMNHACRDCHDGRAAFSIDGDCSRCHDDAWLGAHLAARQKAVFRHAPLPPRPRRRGR